MTAQPSFSDGNGTFSVTTRTKAMMRNLQEMHDRLAEMKRDIYRGVGG